MKDDWFDKVMKLFFTCAIIIAICGAFISIRKETASTRIEETENIALSDEILAYILDLRIENSYIVYAQARLESGNFTSEIFKENNNLFGMKVAERRPTTAIGVNRGHAVYKSWRESVIDYALMQAAYYRGLDEKTYLDKICSVYATDPNYRKRLEEMKNEN